MKFRLMGPPATVTIRGRFLELDSAAALHRLAPGPDLGSNSAGDRIWILPQVPAVDALTNAGLRVISAATVSAIDGHRALFSVTEHAAHRGRFPNVGVQLNLLPQSRGNAVDLRAFVSVTEFGNGTASSHDSVAASIRTNAFFGAQVRLPKGSNLFLLSGRTNAASRRIGSLLWAGR